MADFKAVVLGISTGGPFALLETIPKLPENFPVGIAVVQHMPPRFTKSLAERLDSLSQVHVKEAADGDAMEPGVVLIAPGRAAYDVCAIVNDNSCQDLRRTEETRYIILLPIS